MSETNKTPLNLNIVDPYWEAHKNQKDEYKK
jgi:hypothetical protein